MGNDPPLKIVDERWESSDLQLLIYARHSNPLTGVVEYQLSNIRRAEPPSHLFRVHMREAILSGLLSVTTGTPRAQMLWLGGGGLVFSKMSEAGIGTGLYTEGAALDVSRSWTRPAVIGGVEHRRQIGRRLVLAFGCRARVTFLSDDMRYANINMLTLVPRIGAGFRF